MHAKNTVRYYLLIIFVLLFFFFTNDFGLVGAQKTAIVAAIAIDKEEDEFSICTQIANPSSKSSAGGQSGQGGESGGNEEFTCVTGKGKTVAQALDGVEKATGWQTKLVFCKLLVLGETLTKGNVFDALDYFLLNEYMNEDCLLAAVNGKAAEILESKTPLGSSSALAVEKVLSPTAEKTGVSLPCNLKDFSVGYFSEGASGFLPLLEKDEQFFKADKTALFKNGKRVGELTSEETFTLSSVKNSLRLADYTLPVDGEEYTLTIRQNKQKIKFKIENNKPILKVDITMYAGIKGGSVSRPVEEIADVGDLPDGALAVASERLKTQILALHEKGKTLGFDLFEATELLQKYESEYFSIFKDTLVELLEIQVSVAFKRIR